MIDGFGVGVDLFPTFLDAAGVPRPDHVRLDGASLLPWLAGGSGGGGVPASVERRLSMSSSPAVKHPKSSWKPKDEARKLAVLQSRVVMWRVDYERPRQTSMYSNGFKIILNYANKPIEIYHLPSDKYEDRNLLDQRVHALWEPVQLKKQPSQISHDMLISVSGLATSDALANLIKEIGPVLLDFASHGNAANCMYLKKYYGISGCQNPNDYHKIHVPVLNPAVGKCAVPSIQEVSMLPFEAAEKLVVIDHSRPFGYF
jgi:hypothetical protein